MNARAATLRLAVFPRSGILADALLVVAGAALVALAERGWDRRLSTSIAAMLTASVAVYAVGLPWLVAAASLDFEQTLLRGLALFVPGDLLKLYLAAALLPGAWRLVERFRGREVDRPPRYWASPFAGAAGDSTAACSWRCITMSTASAGSSVA